MVDTPVKTNGAGKHPVITHPTSLVSNNSAPTQVFQVNGFEHAADALKASAASTRIMSAIGLVIGIISGCLTATALTIGIISHETDRIVINEFSQWADLTYAREVQVNALLKAKGVDTSHLPPIQQPPTRR